MKPLFVTTSGKGKPLIVLHGWGVNSTVWERIRPKDSKVIQRHVAKQLLDNMKTYKKQGGGSSLENHMNALKVGLDILKNADFRYFDPNKADSNNPNLTSAEH